MTSLKRAEGYTSEHIQQKSFCSHLWGCV